MANRQVAYVNVNAGGAGEQSTFATGTLDIRSGFGANVACEVFHQSGVSGAAEVWAQRSVDGGNTYDGTTEKVLLHTFNSVGNVASALRKSVFLDAGQWLIAVMRGGPASCSARINTAEVITAYA